MKSEPSHADYLDGTIALNDLNSHPLAYPIGFSRLIFYLSIILIPHTLELCPRSMGLTVT
jgi:hypothetical protein